LSRSLIILVLVHISICLVFSLIIFPNFLQSENRKIGYDEYDVLAWNLAQGKGFRSDHGELSVVRGPSYPAFLAVVYLISGGQNYWVVQILQACISAGTLIMLFHFARSIFNRKTAFVAALIYALHPLVFWFAARVFLETYMTFFLVATLLVIQKYAEKPNWKKLLLVGVLLASCVYIKTVSLFLLPVFFIFLLISQRKPLKVIADVAIVLVIVVLLVLPWTIRNYMVTDGAVVPVHASLALPLLGGHYEALSFFQSPLSPLKGIEDSFEAFPHVTTTMGFPRAEYPYRSLQEELIVDKAALAFMVKYYKENPWMLIQNSLIRFATFWYFGHKPIYSIIFIILSLISLSMVLTTVLRHWRNRRIWLPLLAIIIYSGIHSMIIGQVRMQVMIIPMMATLMAPAFLAIWSSRIKPLFLPDSKDAKTK
jgi:4-amino-4-deoxy-L-arabinose transferase-like glycosyltransferase